MILCEVTSHSKTSIYVSVVSLVLCRSRVLTVSNQYCGLLWYWGAGKWRSFKPFRS